MGGQVQHIVTPQGDVLVVMPLAQYQAMSAAAGAPAFPGMALGIDAANGPGADRSDAPAISGQVTPMQVRQAIAGGESPLGAWRRYRNISQSKLARAAGVSRFTIIRMEAARAGAGNRQSRELLAAALGIPIGAL
jgi:DNA-binding XRE family transcriptional regulator